MTIQEMKTDIVQTAKECYDEKLFAATSGNLSIIDREKGIVAITPSGISYKTMTAQDIMIIDLDGKILEGAHKPSTEWKMHLKILEQCTHINSVVHTHSPYATAFAVCHKKIPVVLIEMLFFILGDIPLAAYQKPGSLELGIGAAELLHNRNACLLANHGVIAVGESLSNAYRAAIYTEDAAKICALANTVGSIVEITEPQQQEFFCKL